MPVADGEVLRVTVFIDAPDSVIMNNVYHYQLSDPNPDNPTDAQILTALDVEMTAIYEAWDDEMSAEYDVDRLECDKVEWNAVDDIWEVVDNIGSVVLAIPGLGISDASPHGCSANISFSTSDPKRRGRKFFPGISEDGVDDSTLIGAVQTVLAAMGVAILADRAVTGGANLIAGIPTTLGTFLPLIVAIVNTISGYQRRRKPGVGT